MKNNSFLDIYHQDKVLRKLILISEDKDGIIDYTDDFCSYFGKIPQKSLFKILSILLVCSLATSIAAVVLQLMQG